MIPRTSKMPKEMVSPNEHRLQREKKLPGCLTINKLGCLITKTDSNPSGKCVDQEPRRNA